MELSATESSTSDFSFESSQESLNEGITEKEKFPQKERKESDEEDAASVDSLLPITKEKKKLGVKMPKKKDKMLGWSDPKKGGERLKKGSSEKKQSQKKGRLQ